MSAGGKPGHRDFDWEAARARLAEAAAAIEQSLAGAPENAREIMDARARALARSPAAEEADGDRVPAVTFVLDKERYAVEARYVREVVPFVDFTPVPGTPEFVVGVSNLRGALVAVFDVRRFFNIKPTGVTDLRRVAVLGVARPEFGMLVDAAGEVVDLDLAALKTPPDTRDDASRHLLHGVTEDAVVVVDGGSLLADERFVIDQNAESPR